MPARTTDSFKFVRFFFVLAGLTTAGLGIGLLFFPSLATNIFLNQPVQKSGLFFIRFAGTSLLGFSVLNFYAVLRDHSLLGLAALINIVSLFPATIISILTYNSDYIDKFRWLIVLEHVFFLTGFIFCWFTLKEPHKSAAL